MNKKLVHFQLLEVQAQSSHTVQWHVIINIFGAIYQNNYWSDFTQNLESKYFDDGALCKVKTPCEKNRTPTFWKLCGKLERRFLLYASCYENSLTCSMSLNEQIDNVVWGN